MQDPIIHESDGSIAPPFEMLTFSLPKEEDMDLVTAALKHKLISENDATQLRILLGLKALELSRNGATEIESIGRIYLKDKQPSFEQYANLDQKIVQYLPNVQLPKVQKEQDTKSLILDQLEKNESKLLVGDDSKPENLTRELPKLSQSKGNFESTSSTEFEEITVPDINNTDPNDVTQIGNQIQPVELDSDHLPPESHERTTSVGMKVTTKNSSLYRDYGLPVVLFVAGILAIAFIFKTCYADRTSNPEYRQDSILHERAPDDPDPLNPNEGEFIFNNPLLNKYKDILSQEIIDSGCKIVVGTFADQENADKLGKSLVKQGYQIALTEHESKTRVILTFDCSQYDLDDYYRNVRRNISAKAWYLIPDYKPES